MPVRNFMFRPLGPPSCPQTRMRKNKERSVLPKAQKSRGDTIVSVMRASMYSSHMQSEKPCFEAEFQDVSSEEQAPQQSACGGLLHTDIPVSSTVKGHAKLIATLTRGMSAGSGHRGDVIMRQIRSNPVFNCRRSPVLFCTGANCRH